MTELEEHSSRRRVLDCAAKLFRQKGYGSTSLRDIAAESGMKAGSLYYHFASKDEIVIDILNIGVQRVNDAVRKAVEGLPASASHADVINTAIHAHLRALHEADDYTSANVRIFGQVPQAVKDAHAGVRQSYEDYWTGLLKAAQTAGEAQFNVKPELVMALMLSSLNATLEWFDPKKGPVERVASVFADIALRGMISAVPVPSKKRA